MKRAYLLIFFFLFSVKSKCEESFFSETPDFFAIGQNHPYMTGVLINGIWIILQGVSQDPEEDDDHEITQHFWLRSIILGLIIDGVLNREKSIPSKCIWLANEYSKRNVLTFFPWLMYESVKQAVSKFF
jgi:hypothetical protein